MSDTETIFTAQPADFTIDVDDDVYVRMRGDWDLCEAPRLREALGTIDARGIVIFDLSRVTYLDSSALRVLVEFKQRSVTFGGTTGVYYGGNERAQKLLTMSGVAGLFV